MLKLTSKILLSMGVWGSAVAALLVYKYNGYPADRLVMGNYSGYISPDVNVLLTSKYGLQTDYFDYDHSAKSRIEKGVYDMSVVTASTLLELKEEKLIKKIDWSKLGLENWKDDNGSNKESIGDKDKAKELFTGAVKKILDSEQELLEYGIPYFINTLGFYYTGAKIEGLDDNTPVDFKTLVQKISSDQRFKSKNGMPQLALIDDPRTVLSLARLVEGKDSINPAGGEYGNYQNILHTYKAFQRAGLSSSQMGRNFLFLNSNSSTLVDALASKTVAGAFMYNGDGLFAFNGGTVDANLKKSEFHMVKLKQDIYFIDFVVLSSKLSGERETKAYELMKELLFNGMLGKQQEILKKNGDKYEHSPVKNFDYVQYTPVLSKEYTQINSSYFSSSEEEDKSDLQKKILEVKEPSTSDSSKLTNFYEKYLDSKTKSDMFIAYENFKLSL